MRIALLAVLLSGCSMLDGLELGQRRLDPNRIYLGGDVIRLGRYEDLDRYACLDAPMYCETWGLGWECRCP